MNERVSIGSGGGAVAPARGGAALDAVKVWRSLDVDSGPTARRTD
jgi:hypothetical protein